MTDIPLKILIIDPDTATADLLAQTLRGASKTILSVVTVNSLREAQATLNHTDINVIFVDPISIALDTASNFIFEVRGRFSSIVFVLYVDYNRMESMRTEFYSGKRSRFNHYFKLNKLTPAATFTEELKAVLRSCQHDLSFNLTQDKINKLQDELTNIQISTSSDAVSVPLKMLQDIQEQLEALKNRPEKPPAVKPKTVFLSYRFAEKEYVEGLDTLLGRDDFTVITGQNANTYISQAILERIRSCEFFICLMTKSDEKKDGTFTTSPWLLEEKGAALAMGKRIVLMVEEGVMDIGGLQGDWQRINFSSKSFINAAIKAVDQLKSYVGSAKE